jgi:hypothetical protein
MLEIYGDVASISVMVRSTARPLGYLCALTPSGPSTASSQPRGQRRADGPHSPCDDSAMIRGGFCSHSSKQLERQSQRGATDIC